MSTRARSSGGVAGHHHVPGAEPLVHQVIPGRRGVLHGGGVGVLRRQTVFKGQHRVTGHVGQLGGKNAGIPEGTAGIAAAVTVEDASPPVVATAGANPGGVHKTELEGLPAHTRHGGYQTAQQLLPLALLVQIFRVHGLGRGRGVDGLQRAQERVQTPLLSLAPLLRRTPGQLHVGTVLLHKNPSFRRPARHKSDQTALGAKWAWPSGDPAGGMLHPAGNAHSRSACMCFARRHGAALQSTCKAAASAGIIIACPAVKRKGKIRQVSPCGACRNVVC